MSADAVCSQLFTLVVIYNSLSKLSYLSHRKLNVVFPSDTLLANIINLTRLPQTIQLRYVSCLIINSISFHVIVLAMSPRIYFVDSLYVYAGLVYCLLQITISFYLDVKHRKNIILRSALEDYILPESQRKH